MVVHLIAINANIPGHDFSLKRSDYLGGFRCNERKVADSSLHHER